MIARGPAWVATAIACGLLSAGWAAPQEGWERAEAAASASAETTDGRKYRDALGQAFGRDHAATVGGCAKGMKPAALSDFDLLVRMDSAGIAEQVLVQPANELTACVQRRVSGWKAAPPPPSGSWVKIGIRLKRK